MDKDDLKDCAWCGLPTEVRSRWLQIVRIRRADGSVVTSETHMVTAQCLGGHWYAGPGADIGAPARSEEA